jgi:hypothetical protein
MLTRRANAFKQAILSVAWTKQQTALKVSVILFFSANWDLRTFNMTPLVLAPPTPATNSGSMV